MHRTIRRWLTGASIASVAFVTLAMAPAQVLGARAATAADATIGFTDACPPAANGDATCMTLTSLSSIPGALGPTDLRKAYGLPSTSAGYGQTVAVVSAYHYPTAGADLSAYRSAYGLPACTTADGCFKQVNWGGGTNFVGMPSAVGLTDVATAASLDMISAVCPNCHILLVEASADSIIDPHSQTDDGLGAAENEAVALGAKFIDNSWDAIEGQIGMANEMAWDTKYFNNHPGVVITAPSGTQGFGGGIAYPAASPGVIAVGGTELAADSSTRGYSETAWGSTGSGCSEFETKPPWQTDTATCGQRMLNDISAAADGNNGLGINYYDTNSSTSGPVAGSGTSFSAAIIAAAYALAGTPASNSTPASYLYANTSGLFDIADGSGNGTCSPAYWCTTGPGYDGPTGLGTPDGVSAFLSGYYQPIGPVRVMDTRIGTGGITGPVGAHTTVKLKIAGAQGIPSANVTGVVLNLTAVSESANGVLGVYPDGTPNPSTSSVNYNSGVTLANLVIVPVGQDGEIDIINGSDGTVQLVGDVFGYFTSDATAAGDSTYTPLTPTRILDTRIGLGAPKQQLSGPGQLALQVGGVDGIPSDISAVAINVTATNAVAAGGILEDYADGTVRPLASNLQFGTGSIAEMAIVPVGADGKIDIHTSITVDVVGDVVGYFSPGTGGETYHAMEGTRLIDTRQTTAIAANGNLTISPGTAVVAPDPTLITNVIATNTAAGGDFIIDPAGTGPTGTSNLNWQTGLTIGNLDLAQTSGGAFTIYNASSGTTEAVVDCFGYLSAG